jgi:hydrogenase-4 component F
MSEQLFIVLGGVGLLLPLLLAAICFGSLFGLPRPKRLHGALGWAGSLVSLILLLYSVWLVAGLHTGHLGSVGEAVLSTAGWQHRFSILLLPEDVFTLDVHIDVLSLYFILLANLVAFAAVWNATALTNGDRLDSRLSHPAFFHGCLNGFHFTILLVPILDNLMGLWIAVELTTVFSALVVGYRDTPAAWEAAWKYLVITSAGIVLALLGTMFLAHAINPELLENPGMMNNAVHGGAPDALLNWTILMDLARGNQLDNDFVTLAFLFILVGYGTRAGLAPMHTWLPDGHGEAPAPVSALLSGVLLKLALYAILRFYTITNAALESNAFSSSLLLGAGLLSLIVATPFILKQNRFKRVLAYHSVEHMGIICVGIGFGTPFALAGALLHTLNHAVTKALMFLAYGNVDRQYRQVLGKYRRKHGLPIDVSDREIVGVLRTMPKTATLLALGGLALVGTPPFGIFISELMILWGAMERFIPPPHSDPLPAGPPDWAVTLGIAVFIVTTTLIFFGLVRHLSDHLLGRPPRLGGDRTAETEQSPRLDKTLVKEPWFPDLIPLLFLGALVLGGVFLLPWTGLLDQCVAILMPAASGR